VGYRVSSVEYKVFVAKEAGDDEMYTPPEEEKKSENKDKEEEGFGNRNLIGIIVGCVILVVGLLIVARIVYNMRKKQKELE